MLRKIYLGSGGGKFALYALFSALMAAYYGIRGGPQELSSMDYTVGLLESADHTRGLGCRGGSDRSSSYTLKVRAANGGPRELELFEECGARFRPLVQGILGKRIAAWSERGHAYRIVSADQVVVDTRGNGNQRVQVVYAFAAFAVFGLITVNRYKKVRAAGSEAAPESTKPERGGDHPA